MASDVQKNTPLADYFVVCGLDVSSGLELEYPLYGVDASAENAQENLSPLERPYKCRVLAHYPQNVPWNPMDEKAACMLCMPNNLSFRTHRRVSQPKYHTFVITREDGSRYFGYALTFFEEVKDVAICEAMDTLLSMHNAEMATSRVSRPPLNQNQSYSNSLPRSLKLDTEKLSFVEIPYDKSDYSPGHDRLFVNKCICFISSTLAVAAFRILLQSLYQRSSAPPPHALPLESYVFNILYEISVPSPGQCSRFFVYPESFFLLQSPGDLELPLMEYSLRIFFGLFGVEAAVDLVSCALLEHQILLCSDDYYLLMLTAECLTNLLFPFSWQHVYAPVLPQSMQNFLDAPVPYIFGLHRCGKALRVDMPRTEGNICFVDVDAQKIRMPEDVPLFPDRAEFISELKDVIKCYGAILNSEFIRHRIQHKESRGFTRKFSLTDMTEAESFREIRTTARSDTIAKTGSNRAHSQGPAIKQQEPLKIAKVLSPMKRAMQKSKGQGDVGTSKELFVYVDEMRFNNAVREVFLNRFVQIFHSYDHFVLHPGRDDVDLHVNGVHTFDKVTFLSDQPDTHLPFLAAFLETQLFATFIDDKVTTLSSNRQRQLSSSVKIFDHRIQKVRDSMDGSLVRVVRYQPCSMIEKTEHLLVQRLKRADSASPKPGKLSGCKKTVDGLKSGFPLLDFGVMNPVFLPTRSVIINSRKKMESHEVPKTNRPDDGRKVLTTDATPSVIATENWDFVDKLLKECKTRTKRMLIEKLSKEAVELGQNEGYVTGVEENTHIASLCDLLERVWTHGLHTKQGKSSLWSHLCYYQQLHEKSTEEKNGVGSDTSVPSSAFAWQILRKRLEFSSANVSPRSRTGGILASLSQTNIRQFVSNRLSSGDLTAMNVDVQSSPYSDSSRSADNSPLTLSSSLVFDMKNVLAMPEIKSALGYARAWVRLSLEKKLLARHLKALLSDDKLLQTLYKRYAFLRNEDEREQFLYHLLSLNAVDFYCFTNTFITTLIPYRIIITPSRKFLSSAPENFWFCLGGTLADSGNILLGRKATQMRKNLGLLTTLRIGLDRNLPNSKWLIDFITVRNEVTGQISKFPCGRWLGRNVEDGSIERLLVTEFSGASLEGSSSFASMTAVMDGSSTLPRTPQRCRSPSANRRSNDSRFGVADIQQMLGDAANSLVKYLSKSEKEKGILTVLLCGEMGLIFSIEQALLYGCSSSRLTRQTYIWPIFENCEQFFRTELLGEKRMPSRRRQDIQQFRHTIRQINKSLSSLGKDGKLQLFLALSIRDHCLDRWLELLSSCPIVDTTYERNSFVRNSGLLSFLLEIIRSLNDFQITLEPSLTRGLEL